MSADKVFINHLSMLANLRTFRFIALCAVARSGSSVRGLILNGGSSRKASKKSVERCTTTFIRASGALNEKTFQDLGLVDVDFEVSGCPAHLVWLPCPVLGEQRPSRILDSLHVSCVYPLSCNSLENDCINSQQAVRLLF